MSSTSRYSRFSFTRLLALLLAAVFVITGAPTLALFNIQGSAFRAATYEGALSEANFYRQFPVLMAGLIQRNIGKDMPAFVRRITPEQWTGVLETLLPEPQLKAMTEDALGQGFAFVNGETQDPQISVAPLKQSLLGPAGMDAVLYLLHSQPDCTLSQAAKMFATLGNQICNPPQEVVDLMRPTLETELQHVAAVLPDKVSMVGNAAGPSVQSRLGTLHNGRLLMQISPVLPLVLLLALTVLAVRTLRDLLIWWGWPFLLTGLLGVALGLFASPLLAWGVERVVLTKLASIFPADVSSSLRAIVETALREMLKPVIWESLVLFVIGLGFLLVRYLLSPGRAGDT